jgi:hypothetical protein
MSTSMMATFLVGMLLNGQSATPTWQTDYSQAQEQSAAQKKPLAVVFGTGGAAKVARDTMSPEATRLLADKYICVYVDTAAPAGRTLADQFKMGNAGGLALSDRTCQVIALRHQGDMTNDSLVQYLQKYADPNLVVTSTENPGMTSRTSFYPTEAGSPPAAGTGSMNLGGMNWGIGGGSCPNCGGGGRRR